MTRRTPASRREAAAGVSRVVGTPAAGLGPCVTEADGPWWARSAGAARVGALGEIETAHLLEPFTLTLDGPTVLHDLLIPGLGRLRANIDHVVVSGRTVLLVDSKVWAPGFVWTVFGRSWRNLSPFPAADSTTVVLAQRRVERHLRARDLPVRVPTPLVVVWPSRADGRVSLWAARYPGARLVRPDQLRRLVARLRVPADPGVVATLSRLVAVPTDRPRRPQLTHTGESSGGS